MPVRAGSGGRASVSKHIVRLRTSTRWPALAIRIGSRSVDGPDPEAARATPSLAEAVDVVAPAPRSVHEDRHGVPGVRGHLRRGRVIARDGDHAGLERGDQIRDRLVHALDRGDLGRAIPVLAGGVRVLHVDEEEVGILSVLLQEAHLLRQVRGWAEDVEAEQGRDAPVHRVDGHGRGAHTRALTEGRQRPLGIEPAQDEAVGGGLFGEHPPDVPERVRDESRGLPGRRVEGPGVERRYTGRLRIRVGDPRIQSSWCSGAPEDDEDAVPLLVVELRTVDLLVEPCHHSTRLLVGDPARASVDDVARGIEGAEVASRRHVARVQRHAEARGAERSSAQQEPDGVVAEQREMSGAGARRDPGPDRFEEPRHPFRRELIEVRRRRVLELGALALVRHPAQTVDDDEEDARTGPAGELGKLHRAMLSTPRGLPAS